MPPSDITVRLRMLGAKRFESEATGAGKSVGRLGTTARRGGKDLDRMGKSAQRSHKHLRLMGRGAAYALGAGGFGGGLYALFDITRKSIGEFQESQRATRQTAAALRSTGGAAGVTAKGISDLSNAVSLKTGIDDEAIQASANLLLTFTKVRNEAGKGNKIFDESTKSIVDMATAMNHGATPSTADLHSATLQLGKALNDPVKGMGALRRVGVAFDEQQQDQIKTLVKHGDRLGAQKLILKELNTEFGGSAAKQATPMKRLQVSLGNLAEIIGKALNPYLAKGASALNKFVSQMQSGKGAGGAFVRTLKSLWGSVKPVATVFLAAGVAVAKFAGKHPTLTKLALAVTGVGIAINAIRTSKAVAGIGSIASALKRLAKTKAGEAVVSDITGAAGLGGLKKKSAPKVAGFKTWMRGQGKTIGRGFGVAIAAGAAVGIAAELEDKLEGVFSRIKSSGKGGKGIGTYLDIVSRVNPITGAPRNVGSLVNKVLGRQHGGPVAPFGSYVVGERGPELLQMGGASGTVIPNMGETTIRVPVHLDGRVITEVVEKRTRQKRARS